MKKTNIKTLVFEIKGATPLLTNNPDTSDPLGPYEKAIKSVSKKTNKTDDDHIFLSRLGWEASLYLFNGCIQIRARNILRMIIVGARLNKKGTAVEQGVCVRDGYHPLRYKGPMIQGIPKRPNNPKLLPMPELDQYYEGMHDRRQVVIKKNRIWCTRAIFEDWSLEFTVDYQDNVINKDDIVKAVDEVGKRIGICENKIENFGRFKIAAVIDGD